LGHRKPLTLITSLIAREFWIVMIVLTFLPGLSATQKIYIFLAVYFLACISGILSANAWILWMGDLIPTAIRGRYLARRNLILVLVALLVDQVGSQFFEWTKERGDPWLGHRTILGVAVVCAAVAGWFLWRQHEPKWHRTEAPPPVQFLREVWANANFKRVLKFFAVWNFGVGLSAAFFSVHMLTVLNMSYPTIWKYTLITTVFGVLASIFWGHTHDRAGTKPILLSNAILIGFLPGWWLFATPDRLWPIWTDAVITGICWTGFNLAAFNLPLVTSPERLRPWYLAVFHGVAGATFGIASLLGGVLAEGAQGFTLHIGPFTWINYHLLFIGSVLIRYLSLYFLHGIEVTPSENLIFLVKMLGNGLQKSFFTGRQFLTQPVRWPR
ncbi:MAG: hypothetical protein V2A74_12900, partial [bacterium]